MKISQINATGHTSTLNGYATAQYIAKGDKEFNDFMRQRTSDRVNKRNRTLPKDKIQAINFQKRRLVDIVGRGMKVK